MNHIEAIQALTKVQSYLDDLREIIDNFNDKRKADLSAIARCNKRCDELDEMNAKQSVTISKLISELEKDISMDISIDKEQIKELRRTIEQQKSNLNDNELKYLAYKQAKENELVEINILNAQLGSTVIELGQKIETDQLMLERLTKTIEGLRLENDHLNDEVEHHKKLCFTFRKKLNEKEIITDPDLDSSCGE